jgi:hypothetical protein
MQTIRSSAAAVLIQTIAMVRDRVTRSGRSGALRIAEVVACFLLSSGLPACRSPNHASVDGGAASADAGRGVGPAADGGACGQADDPHHCGACGNDCTALPNVDPARVSCAAGACILVGACRPGFGDCNGSTSDGCETDVTLPAHCGTCSNLCGGATPYCANAAGSGSCVAACAGATPSTCGMSCVDETSDPHHCGSCLGCPAVAHGAATCVQGVCYPACDPGYDIDGPNCTPHQFGWTIEPIVPPLLNQGDFTAVWGSGPTDVYAVNSNGSVMHSDGTGNWQKQPQSLFTKAGGIWGSAPHNIYIAADKEIYHSTGDGYWQTQEPYNWPGHVTAIWGSGPNDIYAVGDRILHSTGDGTWQEQQANSGTATSVWGSGAHDIYALAGDYIMHSTGDGKWISQNFPHPLSCVWGSSATDVWVFGLGFLLHTGGDQTWSPQAFNQSQYQMNGCWGSGPDDIYLSGGFISSADGEILHETAPGMFFYAGPTIPPSGAFNGVWGSGPNDVYAVGTVIMHLH